MPSSSLVAIGQRKSDTHTLDFGGAGNSLWLTRNNRIILSTREEPSAGGQETNTDITGGLPMGNYLASNYGISPNNSDNTDAWNALVAAIRATTYGGRIWMEPAPYDFRSATTDPGGAPIEVHGSGVGMTYLRTAGPMLSAGDLFTPKRGFRMFDLTLSSTATRTGGTFVKLIGDMLIGDVPSKAFQSYEFGNVNQENGYEGVWLIDGAGPLGVCGFFWDGCYNHTRGFAAGGAPFVINTPNGVVNKIQNVIHSETAGMVAASRPRATIHMTGAADFRLTAIENVYTVRGLIIDPGAGGRVATIFMTDCIWGQNTSESVLISPNASADCHAIQMNGGYVDTGGISVNANPKSLYGANITFLGNAPNDALKLDGTSGAVFENMIFDGANSKCFHALNSAKNFRLTGMFRNNFSNNTLGVHIEAGCDKYQVSLVGGEYCTTPTNVPTNDATKQVSVF